MFNRKKKFKPTEAELSILNILWSKGPSTVRNVYEEINRFRQSGYTTVLKIMQIMHEKGLVQRDKSARAHIYKTVFSEADTQGQLATDLVNKAFGGSLCKLMVRMLDGNTDKKEIDEIRKLLDELEGKSQ